MSAVIKERSPLKKPWLTAPAIKLMPAYLHRVATWAMGVFIGLSVPDQVTARCMTGLL